jgi:tetratricopeptide (TPR) repeat protein
MKRNPLFTLIFIFSGIAAFGQNQQLINTIKSKLARAEGEQRFHLLNDLAWQYRVAYPDSAISYAKEAYDLGLQLKIKTQLARPLNFAGLGYNYRGDPLTAFQYYNKALTTATLQRDLTQLAHANNNIGRLFFEQGLVVKSHEYFGKALNTFRSINDSSGLAYTYQSLGTLLNLQKKSDEAERNFLHAYELRLKLKDSKEIMSAQTQLGKFYQDNLRYDEALRYFQLADSTGNVIQDAINLAEVKTLTADVYLHKGLLAQAEKMCLEGLRYIQRTENKRLLPSAYLTMGQVYFEKGNLTKAKKYFLDALQVSTARKDLNARIEAHYMLWKTSEQQHNSADELFNFNQYITLKDSLADLEIAIKQERLNFEVQIARQAQENEMLKVEEAKKQMVIEQQRLHNLILIIVLASVCIILFLIWRNWRRAQRTYRELAVRKEEIEKINGLLNLKNETLAKHLSTLLSFSKNRNIITGHLEDAAKDVAKITAQRLKASLVSVWLYHEHSNTIHSLAMYSLKDDATLPYQQLNLNDYPNYFNSLKKEKVIVIGDASTHEHTRELHANYLSQLNVRSMLDATFFIDGKLKGLICCEQHEIREWTSEDVIFAASAADILSLTYRTKQRREHEKQIKAHTKEIEQLNESLEGRVKERTEELEIQNNQLAEYAFINSHLLRGPLSRILGLINLIEHDKTLKADKLIELLRTSGTELDSVVQKITDTLQTRTKMSREDFRD